MLGLTSLYGSLIIRITVPRTFSRLAEEKPHKLTSSCSPYFEEARTSPPCGLQWRKLVELYRKKDSRFYWYDFKVRGKRYRGSTKETSRRGLEGLPLCGSTIYSKYGSAGPEGSQPAGALGSVPGLRRISSSSGPDKEILRKWLATVVQQNYRRHASRPHSQGYCGGPAFRQFSSEREQCITNAAPDAPQERRVESPHQGSKIQAVAGAGTQAEAG